jgi:hypothetical protein
VLCVTMRAPQHWSQMAKSMRNWAASYSVIALARKPMPKLPPVTIYRNKIRSGSFTTRLSRMIDGMDKAVKCQHLPNPKALANQRFGDRQRHGYVGIHLQADQCCDRIPSL